MNSMIKKEPRLILLLKTSQSEATTLERGYQRRLCKALVRCDRWVRDGLTKERDYSNRGENLIIEEQTIYVSDCLSRAGQPVRSQNQMINQSVNEKLTS